MNVYLDYAATTPVDARVIEEMRRYLGTDGIFANPSSAAHVFGAQAESAIGESRERLAECLGCKSSELVFTSGATESDNLAILGAAELAQRGQIVTVATEHKAVLAACEVLQRRGFQVAKVRPNSSGLIDPQQLAKLISNETVLVSVMHVNNETGVIQDICQIGEMVRKCGALFHVDAAQSIGKIPIDLSSIPVDLMSISAHKVYGPKGVGALFVRRAIKDRIAPQMHGGGQENGLRSGTLATHQIVGLAEAVAIARQVLNDDASRIRLLSDRFLESISEAGGITVNSDRSRSLPNILNVSFSGVDAEALMANLPDLGISSTSACTSGALEPSHVLRAMGIEGDRLYGAIRFSFGRFTTMEEVDYAAGRVVSAIRRLRVMGDHVAASN